MLKSDDRLRGKLPDTDALVERHKKLVYHLVARLIRDPAAREDVFQEVFLNIVRSLPGFEGKSKLSTWIASVAIHTCYGHVRKTKKDGALVSLDEWLEDEGNPGLSPPAAGNPEDKAETRLLLEQHLERLPPLYKLPIWLFYFEGRSYEDVAEALNVPLGTVKIRLYRGLRRLRQSIEGASP
jgi:RNA polymerase sigma factor (sigma-70 family)